MKGLLLRGTGFESQTTNSPSPPHLLIKKQTCVAEKSHTTDFLKISCQKNHYTRFRWEKNKSPTTASTPTCSIPTIFQHTSFDLQLQESQLQIFILFSTLHLQAIFCDLAPFDFNISNSRCSPSACGFHDRKLVGLRCRCLKPPCCRCRQTEEKSGSWGSTQDFMITLQESNISHLGKRKILFKSALAWGYISFQWP